MRIFRNKAYKNSLNLKYDPPIETKSTDDLLEMIANSDDWNEDAITIAKDVLAKRGIKYEKQIFEEQINKKAKRRKNIIKENAGYSIYFRIILLVFPFIIFFPLSFETIIGLENEGYYKKAKERFFYLLAGFIIWILIALYFLH